jgi:hypothetical protein
MGPNKLTVLDTTGHGLRSSISTPKELLVPTVQHLIPAAITSAPTPSVYKYMRSAIGVVGTITDPSGITSNITNHIIDTVGSSRAAYLDAHGFGCAEIEHISDAYDAATDVQGFVSLAIGHGMAVTELEWFWDLS